MPGLHWKSCACLIANKNQKENDMPTITHTDKQREAWNAAKKIAKQKEEYDELFNSLDPNRFMGKKESIWKNDPMTRKKRMIRRATGGRP